MSQNAQYRASRPAPSRRVFGQELTQGQIGRRVGLSRVRVFRLLARIPGELRAGLLGGAATAGGTAG